MSTVMTALGEAVMTSSATAVSYTHLDVYKRQVLDLSRQEKFNHAFEVRGGVWEAQCRAVLQDFLLPKRKIRPKA